jgi:hypothetical protein
MELLAPTITTASAAGASGTSCEWCGIDVHSDTGDEGGTYEGYTSADGNGNWTYASALTGPNVTAINTDGFGNSSEFSAPYPIAGPVGTCANPLPISCGVTVFGDTANYANNHDGYQCGWDASGPEVIYRFTLPPGPNSTVTAEFLSWSADMDIYLLAPGGCDTGQCLTTGSYGDVSLTVPNVPPGTYYLAVDGYSGASGTYDLQFRCTAHRLFLPLIIRGN